MNQRDVVRKSLALLDRGERRRVYLVTFIQILLGFLDLAGVAAIGILGALAVNGIQSRAPGNRISSILEFLSIEDFRFQSQVAIIGALAAVVLVSRTIFTMYFTRRILYFLSAKSASISSSLIAKLLTRDLLAINRKSSQETLYALTSGVNLMMLNVIGTVVGVTSDVFLLFMLSIGLFFVDPIVAFASLALFVSVGAILYFSVQKRAAHLGQENANLNISSNQKILEVLNSYRELYVRNRRAYYSEDIRKSRYSISHNSAELAFMPNIGKYVIEITLVVGAILISASQFLLQDAVHSISTLSVFLAAGTRIAPAILRIQAGAIAVKSTTGAISPTLDLIDRLSGDLELVLRDSPLEPEHEGFLPQLKIQNLEFTYPGNDEPTIRGLNLEIQPGQVVAFVGPSGAGKTTLVDLMLGILNPTGGVVSVSNMPPSLAIERWPGAIGYVPQDVEIVNGTIRENIALGFPDSDYRNELFEQAINLAQLSDFVTSLPDGIDTFVGERGSRISGGQRQRLGIARALYTNPKLIVLDEATSSLDGKTESEVSKSIQALKGRVAVIMIAHRLSTVRSADLVCYLDSGNLLAAGTFDHVRNQIPDFDQQAKLMGL